MALLVADGFDTYSLAQIPYYYTSASTSNASIQSTISRNGGFSLYVPNNVNYLKMSTPITSGATFIFGAALQLPTTTQQTANNTLIGFIDSIGSTIQCALKLNASGALQCFANGTAAGSPISALSTTSFHYVEFEVVLSTTATGSVQLWVDGVSLVNVTGIVTAANRSSADTFSIGCGDTYTFAGYLDDMYVIDTTGTVNNARLGDVKIISALPNGNGRVSQWTRTGGTTSGNYTAVSDNPSDGDTSYVASATVGAEDAYAMTTVTAANVVAVQVVAIARKDDATTRYLGLGVGNGTTENFDSGQPLGSGYQAYKRILNTNPLTSANWAKADLTTLQAAIKVIS